MAEPWYKTAISRCDDPLILRDLSPVQAALSSNLKILADKTEPSRKYVELSARSLREKEIEVGKRVIIGSSELSAPDASLVKGLITHRAGMNDFPWFVGDVLPDPVFPSASVNFILTTAMDYFLSRADTEKVNVEILSKFIAAGGSLVHDVYLTVNDDKRYTIDDELIYSVHLGKEVRSSMLLSCSYPVKVRISEVKGYTGGKEAFHIKDRDGTYWTMYRIDGSIGDYLKLYAEDDDFLYFNLYGTCEDPAVLDEGLCTQIRVDTKGGGIEWRYNKENWGDNQDTVYGTTSITD